MRAAQPLLKVIKRNWCWVLVLLSQPRQALLYSCRMNVQFNINLYSSLSVRENRNFLDAARSDGRLGTTSRSRRFSHAPTNQCCMHTVGIDSVTNDCGVTIGAETMMAIVVSIKSDRDGLMEMSRRSGLAHLHKPRCTTDFILIIL